MNIILKIIFSILVISFFYGVDYYFGHQVGETDEIFRNMTRAFLGLAALGFVAGIFISFEKPVDAEEEMRKLIGNVWIGMTKENLKKAGYVEQRQVEYRKEKEGNEEYISYIPLGMTKYKKPITFYICDGKVRKWDLDTIEGLRGMIQSEKDIGKVL